MAQPYLGTTEENIRTAEEKLGLSFPPLLRQTWLTYNRVELTRGHWRVFPIFDPSNPKRTCNDIVYENTKGRHLESEDLLAIAENYSGTGNRLVLKLQNGVAGEQPFIYTFKTGKLKPWGGTLEDLLLEAKASVAAVEKLTKRYAKET